MVDISLCKGVDRVGQECKKKHSCYRYLAKPDEYRQSYILIKDWKGCEHYWECKKSECERLNKEHEG